MEKTIVAIPSTMPGGMQADVGEHFGHCEIYTLVELGGTQVLSVGTLPNVPHEHGGCMAPVQYLADNGVTVLIAGGMGMRPLLGCKQVGIDVFHGGDCEKVDQAVSAFVAGKLAQFSVDSTCGGCA